MLLHPVTTASGAVLPFTGPLLSAAFYTCKIKPSRPHYTHKSPVPALIYSCNFFGKPVLPRNQMFLQHLGQENCSENLSLCPTGTAKGYGGKEKVCLLGCSKRWETTDQEKCIKHKDR